MPARLITKCPECDGVTGDCVDSTMEADRTEYDGKRCRRCAARAKRERDGKPHAMNCGSGNSYFIGRKRMALATHMLGVTHY